jgi:K+-transporting ATPase ATPase A chain
MIVFTGVLFVYGFAVLSLQPFLPLNPLGRTMLSPTTIFNSVVSFMTNTNLQHYSGDQHFSNFSQIFFCIANMFLSAAIGFCALTMIIRAFRGEKQVGNFFLDMWRVVIYIFFPMALIVSVIFLQQGMPMTLDAFFKLKTLEGADQTIITGPVAALVPLTRSRTRPISRTSSRPGP